MESLKVQDVQFIVDGVLQAIQVEVEALRFDLEHGLSPFTMHKEWDVLHIDKVNQASLSYDMPYAFIYYNGVPTMGSDNCCCLSMQIIAAFTDFATKTLKSMSPRAAAAASIALVRHQVSYPRIVSNVMIKMIDIMINMADRIKL